MNAGANGNIAVEMRAISKRFGGVHALREVNFSAQFGEIHALLGENGAGKSTILKILRGVLAPDSGEIIVDGSSFPSLTAKAAREHGIGMIFQEMSLVPTLTVAQNVFLNNEPFGRTGLIDERAMRERSLDIFRDMGVEIDPAALVGELSTGQQQLAEIAKALSQDARILVLNEPTSALTATEVEILFGLVRRLRSEGKAIIYVSHRMDEIFQLADRATVLRDGRHIDTRPIADYTLTTLIADIMGKATRDLLEYATASTSSEDVVLEVRNLRSEGTGAGASFALHQGEVLGIAGLLGSGRSRLARMLFGLEPVGAGEILLRNEPFRITSPQVAMAAGMALVPEDRRRQGLVLQHSVAHKIELPVLGRLGASAFISGRTGRQIVRDTISRMGIKTQSPDSAVNTLSGGNQQKVVIGKWLATAPDILIMDEATAGIDIGSKGEILRLVRELASEGKSIIFISSELAELLAVSDRICVMARGEIVQTFDARQLMAGDQDPQSELQAEQKLQLLLQQGSGMAEARSTHGSVEKLWSYFKQTWRQNIIYIGFAVVFVFFAATLHDRGFLDPNNVLNIARQTAVIEVMAVAMTLVLSSGEIDLSVGAVAGLASVTTAMALSAGGLGLGIVAGRGAGEWRPVHASVDPDIPDYARDDGNRTRRRDADLGYRRNPRPE